MRQIHLVRGTLEKPLCTCIVLLSVGAALQGYLTKKRKPLGPYRMPMPRVLGGSQGGRRFLIGEVPLQGVVWWIWGFTADTPQLRGAPRFLYLVCLFQPTVLRQQKGKHIVELSL